MEVCTTDTHAGIPRNDPLLDSLPHVKFVIQFASNHVYLYT